MNAACGGRRAPLPGEMHLAASGGLDVTAGLAAAYFLHTLSCYGIAAHPLARQLTL